MIMEWFTTCDHEILLTHSNKHGYIGMATDKEADSTYKVVGEDEIKVLSDLKSMLSGTYNL